MKRRYRLGDVDDYWNRAIFLNSDVLLYLFWPTGSYHWEKLYSRIFGALLYGANQLVVDPVVVYQFITKALQCEHKKLSPKKEFKDFCESVEGREALEDIEAAMKNDLVTRFELIENPSSSSQIIDYQTGDNLDHLDHRIERLCQDNDFIFLTHSKEFKNAEIEILTANPILLK